MDEIARMSARDRRELFRIVADGARHDLGMDVAVLYAATFGTFLTSTRRICAERRDAQHAYADRTASARAAKALDELFQRQEADLPLPDHCQ